MSGIRVIYAYHVAASKVEFIEIYFKGEKENEDRERIKGWKSIATNIIHMGRLALVSGDVV